MLNRHIPIDLRLAYCSENTVVSSCIHEVGVTLLRRESGFDLFIPQSFAVSVINLLRDSAEQFGYEIVSNEPKGSDSGGTAQGI